MSHMGSDLQMALSVNVNKNFCWTSPVLGKNSSSVFFPANFQLPMTLLEKRLQRRNVSIKKNQK